MPTTRGAGDPTRSLTLALERASASNDLPIVNDLEVRRRIELVVRSPRNRACIRFLLACALAKSLSPELDIRKPYTEIGTSDAFSGRVYDERYIGPFVQSHGLDCNTTTAFLTPAFRNKTTTLTPDMDMAGNDPEAYKATLQLLTDVQENKVSSEDVLAEAFRLLLLIKGERLFRFNTALNSLNFAEDTIPLSSEDIVKLVEQHLKSPYSSRLPVLVVAAAYRAAEQHLRERVLPLMAHNAADLQTKALGDVQIVLVDDNKVVTVYEMKAKRVTVDDINLAIQKVYRAGYKVDNYIFITTDTIRDLVREYATSMYKQTGGIEFAILDCIEFMRHFLHLFHRIRIEFLDTYQELVLAEPDSAVRQELKVTFLALRRTYESAYNSEGNSNMAHNLELPLDEPD